MNKNVYTLTDKFLDTLIECLVTRHIDKPAVSEVLAGLQSQIRKQTNDPIKHAIDDPAYGYLDECLDCAHTIDHNVALAIENLVPYLYWQRIGEHITRPDDGIMSDYTYCQIIGPFGIYPGEDFMLGLFIIGKNQFYPEHFHDAPEFYWLLNGPTQWRFEKNEPWQVKNAGDIIYNKPNQVHAMKTKETPLFALWCWPKHINGSFNFSDVDSQGIDNGQSLISHP